MNKKIGDWRSIFADREASGESGKDYCRAWGIAYSTLKVMVNRHVSLPLECCQRKLSLERSQAKLEH